MFKRKSTTKEPDSFTHAYEYSIFMLGLRLYTEGELLFKMKERGYELSVIDKVLEELKRNNYVNDERFAEMYIDSAKRFKTYGYYMLKKKLLEKRLNSNFAEQMLDKYFSSEDEAEVAQRFINKLKLRENLSYEEKQKIAGKLRQRGFRNDSIHLVLFKT